MMQILEQLACGLMEGNFDTTDDYGRIITGLKFKGIDIVTRDRSLTFFKTTAEAKKALSNDLKILKSKFDDILDKELDSLLKLGNETWSLGFSNILDLKRNMTMDLISWSIYSDGTRQVSIHYNNNRSHQNEKFFGGHTFVIELNISKDGKFIGHDSQLEG